MKTSTSIGNLSPQADLSEINRLFATKWYIIQGLVWENSTIHNACNADGELHGYHISINKKAPCDSMRLFRVVIALYVVEFGQELSGRK